MKIVLLQVKVTLLQMKVVLLQVKVTRCEGHLVHRLYIEI